MQFKMGGAVLMFLIVAVAVSTVLSCNSVCRDGLTYYDGCEMHECVDGKDRPMPKVVDLNAPKCNLTDAERFAKQPKNWIATRCVLTVHPDGYRYYEVVDVN